MRASESSRVKALWFWYASSIKYVWLYSQWSVFKTIIVQSDRHKIYIIHNLLWTFAIQTNKFKSLIDFPIIIIIFLRLTTVNYVNIDNNSLTCPLNFSLIKSYWKCKVFSYLFFKPIYQKYYLLIQDTPMRSPHFRDIHISAVSLGPVMSTFNKKTTTRYRHEVMCLKVERLQTNS